MAPRPARLILLFFVWPFLSLKAQDLRLDKPFFDKKKAEFNAWLRFNHLGHLLKADSIAVSNRKVSLFLRPTYSGKRTCDSLQCAWQKLENANRMINGQSFHERLLHKWAFLAEIHENQAEVVIRCHEPPHFHARVYTKAGRVPVDERNIRSGSMISVQLPASLQGINSGDNQTLLRDKNLGQVCTKARQWLVNQYKAKGTPILWKAKIDTSYTAYDEFVLEVTHLNNEICPDGYFEYHRVYVKGIQKGTDVELSWEFQGKYGSGIIFPPRKNDYKDMELKYKSSLEEYQKRLFKKMLDYLR
ncbi:MAG: hypothetical protein J0M29_04465 [Chitinophagales bacterium]|nr:hypothetical protein [Chitinophagales bacterium]